MATDDVDEALASVTLARLLADHGDVRRARRVLAAVLRRRPDDPQARALERTLRDARHAVSSPAVEPSPAPRLAARAGDLASRFRRTLGRARDEDGASARRRLVIRRLRRWLAAIDRRPRPETPCPSSGPGARLDRRPGCGGAP